MLTTFKGVVQDGRIHLTNVSLPEGAQVLVTVIPFTDEGYARRKANRWLAEYVGDMLMADHPLLTHSGERQVWRFGAYVTSLKRDPFGPVGYVDIDSETGAVLMDKAAAEEIAQLGEQMNRLPLAWR
jgi:hypothetical protein